MTIARIVTLSIVFAALLSPDQARAGGTDDLPDFFLNQSLTFAPSPLALKTVGGEECGQHLDDAFGMELNFDYRLWYFFIGTHLAFSGDDNLTMGEYGVRVGGFIPLSERFSIVGAAWLGLIRLEEFALDYATEPSMEVDRDEAGLLLGASIGVRYMVASWFGLTADMSLSTGMWADADYADPDGAPPRLQINRWQAHTGLLFAW